MPSVRRQSTIVANALPILSTDSKGVSLLAVRTDGVAEVHTFPGNRVTPIDVGVTSAMLTPDGAAVVYTTAEGSLRRASTTGAAPPVEIARGFHAVLALSPDGRHAIVSPQPATSPQDDFLKKRDRYLAQLAAPGTPALLAAAAFALLPVAFTHSGKHAVYMDHFEPGQPAFVWRARPVDGGADVLLTTGGVGFVEGTNSSDLVIVEGRTSAKGDRAIFSLKAGDLDRGWNPTQLVDDIDPRVAVYDRRVYFSVAEYGLYSLELP